MACATWIVTSASAQASVPNAERRDALGIAAKKWGAACTRPPLTRFARMNGQTLGEARWDGMWDVPSDQRDGCKIVLNSARSWNWDLLCTTVVHEYGHLAGHGHSRDENSAMHTTYDRPYPGCVRGRAARRWSD